jgi:hypothetical protein
MELRYALGAFAVGAALAAVALAGCNGDEPAGQDDLRERDPAASSPDLEDYPPCPDRSREQAISNAEILDGGYEIRAFYAGSSSHVPCGYAVGDNGRALVVHLRTTDPRVATADLIPRCVDLALPERVDESLDVVLVPPGGGDGPSPIGAKAREQIVGQDGCRDVRQISGATIDVD